MLGNVAGRHRSPHRGSSVEFAEYRKYVPGDDTRRLDWKAYARSDRYYIKEFEADTNLRAYFVIDHSASMAFADRGMPKYQYASRIVADRKSTRLNSSHITISYAGFCLKKKK